MKGIDFLRALRATVCTCTAPVVVFTADWEVEDLADEIRGNGGTIVSKLRELAEVEQVLASLCNTRLLNRSLSAPRS